MHNSNVKKDLTKKIASWRPLAEFYQPGVFLYKKNNLQFSTTGQQNGTIYFEYNANN